MNSAGNQASDIIASEALPNFESQGCAMPGRAPSRHAEISDTKRSAGQSHF